MLESLGPPFLIFVLCMARCLAAFRTAPLLGASVMPPQALTAFGMSIVLLIFPVSMASAPPEFGLSWLLLLLLLKEILIGFIFGFLLGILFWAAQSLGALVDNQRGAGMAVGSDPLSGDQATPYASLFFQCTAMLFFQCGAFATFAAMVVESYALWPIFDPLPNITGPALKELMLLQADAVLRIAVTLGAPILALCFLTDFCLGLTNRFAQQLNVFVLAMPIKSGVVLFVLLVYAGTMLGVFGDGIRGMDVMYRHLREALR